MAEDLPIDQTKTLDIGIHEAAPVLKSGEVFGVGLTFDTSAHTDPQSVLIIETYASMDNGQTWDFAGGCTRIGGAGKDLSGNPVNTASFSAEHNISALGQDGKWYNNQPKWRDPLIKTVVKVQGKAVDTKISPITVKPRTADSTEIHHSIAVVQTVGIYGGNVTSNTTSNITTTGANLLVAWLPSLYFSSAAFVSFGDNKSNTWTESVGQLANGGVGYLRQEYVENCIGGSGHNFTHTTNRADSWPSIIVHEVSGYLASAFDKEADASDVSTTSHTAGPTATISQANELLLTCGTGATTITETYAGAGAPWVTEANQANSATGNGMQGAIAESQVVASATTYSWTYTTNTAMRAVQCITTWKEGAAPTGGTTVISRMMLMGVS